MTSERVMCPLGKLHSVPPIFSSSELRLGPSGWDRLGGGAGWLMGVLVDQLHDRRERQRREGECAQPVALPPQVDEQTEAHDARQLDPPDQGDDAEGRAAAWGRRWC